MGIDNDWLPSEQRRRKASDTRTVLYCTCSQDTCAYSRRGARDIQSMHLPPSTYSHSWATTAFTRTTTKIEGDEKRSLVLSGKVSASKSSMGASYRGGSYSMPWVLVRRGNTVLYQGYQRVQRVVGEVRVALQSSSGEMEFRRFGWHFENPMFGGRANKRKMWERAGGSKELLAPWAVTIHTVLDCSEILPACEKVGARPGTSTVCRLNVPLLLCIGRASSLPRFRDVIGGARRERPNCNCRFFQALRKGFRLPGSGCNLHASSLGFRLSMTVLTEQLHAAFSKPTSHSGNTAVPHTSQGSHTPDFLRDRP